MKTAFILALAGTALALPMTHSDFTIPDSVITSTLTEEEAKAAIAEMQITYEANTLSMYSGSCNPENVRVRKSWSTLSDDEKLEYLSAVKCMASYPTTLDTSKIPGAHNRRDDFTWTHLEVANYVHASGLLLPWHRHFLYLYEEDLRAKCNYTGAHPWWDWAEHADDQSKSPVFSGDELSFGGNGAYVPGRSLVNSTLPNITTASGDGFYVTVWPATGGGCVTDGFFADMDVTLGPVAPANVPPDNIWGLKDNPRCIIRDFNSSLSQRYLNYSAVANQLNQSDIHSYHPLLESAMHPNSHQAMGGGLFDFYASPGDPTFYLLHAMHDRMWSMWQGQDYANRLNALDGTVTFANLPPSENATLDYVMDMGAIGDSVRVEDVMSTVSGTGGYCYVYE